MLEKVGRSLSDRFGVRVVCQGERCCTDGRTIFLPSLPDELPPGMLQIIRGYLDHESGHLLGKSNFRILKWFKENYGALASRFLNMLEDLRVEEIMRQRFPGSRKNLDASYDYLAKEAAKAQRTVQNLGRKGVSNGWVFWQWDGKPTNINGEEEIDDMG